jgi:hypothetical protein
MTYAPNEQKYGKEFFTNLDQIMSYWDCIDYRDWGAIGRKDYRGGNRTFFFGIIM